MPKSKKSRKPRTRSTTYVLEVPGGVLLRNGARLVAVECSDPRCGCAAGEVTFATVPR